ncbi:MAG: VTT domain-containing protein [Candidatus Eisenbacteria bacterium]|uniref:VTT domain-containing protein n=1 Tax=Eiseniibacteriota bacterium TaxID=2212470 RepID=A0A9D6QKL6_UNCEI|nr:VTT domain-containing protein [Candidatus Eisenbacteria bacterium]MBI3540395.1 VTT domain-containing protein [Candidatus Eisenbacteria bacterium]
MTTSLWMMVLLLFAEGGTLSFLTTPTLLYYGRYHESWVVALAGSAASAAGSALQLWALRWALDEKHAWMHRFAPSRRKVDDALKHYPAATFLGLLVARATPLPDAPLKIVAAVVRYSIGLYTLAVLLGALPYFYVLALVGREVRIPNWVLIASIVAIALGVGVDWLRKRRAVRA